MRPNTGTKPVMEVLRRRQRFSASTNSYVCSLLQELRRHGAREAAHMVEIPRDEHKMSVHEAGQQTFGTLNSGRTISSNAAETFGQQRREGSLEDPYYYWASTAGLLRDGLGGWHSYTWWHTVIGEAT